MGKTECTKICGHFLQCALWFWNGRFPCALIKPSKGDCFFSPALPPLGSKKGTCPPAMSNLITPLKGWQESQTCSLWGWLCPPWGGTRTASEWHLHGTGVNKATSGALPAAAGHKRGQGRVIPFPKRSPQILSPCHTPLFHEFLWASNNFFKRCL